MQVNELEALVIEHECEAVATRYTHALNLGSAVELAALFAPDGTLELPDGKLFRGAEEIRRWAEERAARPVRTRHLRTNSLITVSSMTAAQGFAYWTLLAAPTLGAEVPALERVTATGEWHERFVRLPAGWRLLEKRATLAMGRLA